jgi:hypothetical protein
MIRASMLAIVCTIAMPVASAVAAPGGASYERGVSIRDATVAPYFAATLAPGKSVTLVQQCPHRGYFTEYSAYRHDGSALAAQNGIGRDNLVSWRGAHGRVTFDGVTFHNGTRARVIVAGWCS